jgi:hypothetical protein
MTTGPDGAPSALAFTPACRAPLRSLAVIYREALQAITGTAAASPVFATAEVMTGTSGRQGCGPRPVLG